jgi:hypothetical protein
LDRDWLELFDEVDLVYQDRLGAPAGRPSEPALERRDRRGRQT